MISRKTELVFIPVFSSVKIHTKRMQNPEPLGSITSALLIREPCKHQISPQATPDIPWKSKWAKTLVATLKTKRSRRYHTQGWNMTNELSTMRADRTSDRFGNSKLGVSLFQKISDYWFRDHPLRKTTQTNYVKITLKREVQKVQHRRKRSSHWLKSFLYAHWYIYNQVFLNLFRYL